jgi:hypothetical protein
LKTEKNGGDIIVLCQSFSVRELFSFTPSLPRSTGATGIKKYLEISSDSKMLIVSRALVALPTTLHFYDDSSLLTESVSHSYMLCDTAIINVQHYGFLSHSLASKVFPFIKINSHMYVKKFKSTHAPGSPEHDISFCDTFFSLIIYIFRHDIP